MPQLITFLFLNFADLFNKFGEPADVYAFGVVCWELWTHSFPFGMEPMAKVRMGGDLTPRDCQQQLGSVGTLPVGLCYFSAYSLNPWLPIHSTYLHPFHPGEGVLPRGHTGPPLGGAPRLPPHASSAHAGLLA